MRLLVLLGRLVVELRATVSTALRLVQIVLLCLHGELVLHQRLPEGVLLELKVNFGAFQT